MSNGKVAKPRIWLMKHVYERWATELVQSNDHYYGKYDKKMSIKNGIVLTEVQGKMVQVMNYSRWRTIVENYFYRARKYIISGEGLRIGSYVGMIAARRVERNPNNRKIKFKETAQEPKILVNGKWVRQKIHYYDDEEYIRIGWCKTQKLANETVYEFRPCKGNENREGFREEFSRTNMENPNLKLAYKYYPYIIKTA